MCAQIKMMSLSIHFQNRHRAYPASTETEIADLVQFRGVDGHRPQEALTG